MESCACSGIDRDACVLNLARVEAMLHHPGAPPRLLHGNALEERRLPAEASGTHRPKAWTASSRIPRSVRRSTIRTALATRRSTSREAPRPRWRCSGSSSPSGSCAPTVGSGIVLPQSVFSNRSLSDVRRFVLERCVVDGILSLPPETFLPFKGVSKASVLFLSKKPPGAGATIALGVSHSVGWDPTGDREGRATSRTPRERCDRAQSSTPPRHRWARRCARPQSHGGVVPTPQGQRPPTRELCSAIFTGISPGRRRMRRPGWRGHLSGPEGR